MDKLVYGDITVDFDALPPVSQVALASEGLTHYLGNRVASRSHAWAQGENQAKSTDKEVVKAWKETNASTLAAKEAEFRAETVAALIDGSIGTRSGGPRLSPIDTVKRTIAREDIATMLRSNGIKVPKGEETLTTKDGAFTMDALIERRLANETTGPDITKRAEKELAAKAKKIALAKAENKDAVLASL